MLNAGVANWPLESAKGPAATLQENTLGIGTICMRMWYAFDILL